MSAYEDMQREQNLEIARVAAAVVEGDRARYAVVQVSRHRFMVIRKRAHTLVPKPYAEYEVYREQLTWEAARKLMGELL